MATIELREVEKIYAGGVHAVRRLDLQVVDGELLVLVGPSGCGKSTVLRLVAGLEPLTSGRILVGGERVDTLPPRERDVAMVFQSYALYAHMTVRENLEFPLRMRGTPRSERRRRAEEVASLLELNDLLEARPPALSGGQQQRVAMGRALVREPRAFLLDEPLSNLDARLRGSVRAHIARIQERLGVTTLYVTHDQVEALGLGHRVAVLGRGVLHQVGPGQELYDRPANTFVAQFLGQPPMNLLKGRLERSGEGWRIEVGGSAAIPLPRTGSGRIRLEPLEGGDVVLGIRPEWIAVDGSGAGAVEGEVRTVEALGPERILHLSTPVRTLDACLEPAGGAGVADAEPVLRIRTDVSGPAPAIGQRLSVERVTDARLFDPKGRALDG